jgi:hypothetical protein
MFSSLLLHILVFGFALWLGCYLLARDPRKPRLRYTGLGLIAYAGSLALDSLSRFGGIDVIRLRWPLLFIPALFWFSAAIDLLPEETRLQTRLSRWRGYGLLISIVVLYSISLGTTWFTGPVYWIIAGLIGTCLLGALGFVWRGFRVERSRRLWGLLLTITLFFTLSMGLVLVPLDWLPRDVILIALDLDMIFLGLCIAVLDAFDEGENFLPDMLYSFTISGVMALLFGGQAALAMVFAGSVTLPLLLLLYGLVTAAIVTQTFYGFIQSAIDRLVFARLTRIRQARADLRAAASSLPRLNESPNFPDMDAAEFARLTRRALSHFSDLNRLSSSPLTRLPLIDVRLSQRAAPDNTLERAAELKMLLAESVARLKPRDKGDIGTSDEWRYYNALYYPYIVGIKPYSYNGQSEALDTTSKTVLDWFQLSVPERTLHNWQNAAARLIAGDLREQMGQIGSEWQ